MGPWESNPHNPMVKSLSSSAIRHTGHADLVEDKKGNWWAVFLGVQPNNGVAQLGSEDKLDIGCYTIRTPYKQEYSLHERPGYLRIWGNAYNLTQVTTPTTYLQKQVSLSAVWSTSLEFYPDNSSTTESGVVLWLSEASHQVIGVRQCDDELGIAASLRELLQAQGTNNTQVETSFGAPATGPVRLYIRAEPTQYTLQYCLDEGKTIKNATSFSNSLLA
ncbi:concanavalin A-like lectin/glucanase domain-containing protein [Aspergillus foveolatus]|uniref:concanavalin A-like lectin/glucanase domain-containing protein n=1 Tax=Aspergillus foveolatus TaxID=210207 RepID=UPI003CCD832D